MRVHGRLIILAVCVTFGLRAADRSWVAAGDGSWSNTANWSGGVLPGAADGAVFNNALTADVAISMDAPEQPIATQRLQNATAPWRRTFAGSLTANVFDQDAGDAVLAGEWRSPAAAISRLGKSAGETARLEIAAGGRLTLTNAASLYIGNASNARGQLVVRAGAEVTFSSPNGNTASGLYIGRESGSVGAVVQTGGRVLKNTSFIPGYTGHGVYELQGGELYHPYGGAQTRYRIGMNGTGLFYQRGGSYTASSAFGYAMEIAQNTAPNVNAFGLFYCDGGAAALNSEVKLLNPGLAAGSASYAELTVAGKGEVTVRSNTHLTLGATTFAMGRAVVNLNGQGVLRAASVRKGAGSQNNAVLNFDGGTFEATHSNDVAFFTTLSDVVVYGGGAKLGSSSGRIVWDAASRLRTAQGNGVSGVTLDAGGSGFAAPPRVTLSGGGGSNATAVAFIDYGSGTVTGLAVTCRGEGYVSAPDIVFVGGAGVGAQATAAIAANVAGPVAFVGPKDVLVNRQGTFDGEVQACGGRLLISSRNDAAPGLPQIAALRLNGGTFQAGSSGLETDCPYDDMINPAAVLVFGGDKGSGEYVQPCGPAGNTHVQNFAAFQVNAGIGRISTTSDSEGAERRAEIQALGFGREPGGLLHLSASAVASMGVRSGAANLFGASAPLLAGVYASASDFVTVTPEGEWGALAAYDDDVFDADKNYRMTGAGLTNALSVLAVNSMRLTDAANLTLSGAGATVVGSGMVAVGDGNAGALVSGGALTSGNGCDLIVYDAHTGFERRNTSANNVSLRISSRIADNGGSPVAFVATGPENVSGLLLASGGVTVLTQATNDYSGGTYLMDAALEVAGDRGLGAVPAAPATNLVTSGMALLRAKKNAWPLTLHGNRGICLKGGCLALTGDDGNQTGKEIVVVNGPISGHGALVFNHWAGGGIGSVITLNGDNRAFEGTYAVHGILRANEGAGLSAQANLALCGHNEVTAGTKAGGILETSGTFTRSPGTGAGEVQWCRANDIYPGLVGNNDPAYSGGFSAYGGPLTVNLGGDRRLLTLGQDGFDPTTLRLQTDAATHDLTWENPVDMAGPKSISIQVARLATDKRVFWRGAITNSSETVRAITIRQNGKLILCDGADIGDKLRIDIVSSLQCLITNRQTLACDFRGAGPLTKWGAGVTVATGVSTNTGDMRIYEGAWFANGQHTLAGSYAVSNGAALGGAGVIAPAAGKTVTVDGALLPGAAEGACGTLTFGSEAQATSVALNGGLSADIGLATNDCVMVYGDATLGAGAALSVTAQDEAVWQARRGEEIPVLTWTGTLVGDALPATPALPQGWRTRISTSEKKVLLSYASPGTMLKVR
jgi:hypothetical protein